MTRQTLVSSLDDTAFGADLAARSPFDALRRLWRNMFRATAPAEKSPVRERSPAVREPHPAVPEAKSAEPAISQSTAVLEEPRQDAAPEAKSAEPTVAQSTRLLEEPRQDAAPEANSAEPAVSQSTALLEEPEQEAAASPATSAAVSRPSGEKPPRLPRVSDATREFRRQCESILHSLRQSADGAEGAARVIGLTSCYPGEGVTTLATHLAITAAANDRRVLLADFHFDAPAVHKMFRAQAGPGLAECLSDGRVWEDVLQPVPASSITLISGGTAEAGHAVPVTRLRNLVRFAAEQFDFAIFDLPPLNRPGDTRPIYELLDGVLLLVESERVRRPVAQRFVTGLERSGAQTLGAVLNKRREHLPEWLYRAL